MCGEGGQAYLGRSAPCPESGTEPVERQVIAEQKSAEGIVGRPQPAEGLNAGGGSRTGGLVLATRQKIQLELAFGTDAKGEAPSSASPGTEANTAASRPAPKPRRPRGR